jgi:anthranilate phosphoribosyltransferase
MERRIYGIFDKKYLRVITELFQKMGYKKVLVFHGEDGLDEVSNVGKTSICELSNGSIKEYSITPEELGIKRAKIDDIRAKSREGNIIDFLRVIYDRDRGPKADLAYLNAAAAFYVLDRVSTIKEGIELAKYLVERGRVVEKLEQFIKNQGSIEKLEAWKKKAQV